MRKTLIIHALGCGGAERVLTSLANNWQARGDDLTILTLDDGHAEPFFRLDPGVQRRGIDAIAESHGTLDAIVRNVNRIARLRHAIGQTEPDVVISFVDTTNILVLLATQGLGVPVIVSERCDPLFVPLPAVWRRLRTLTYPWAAAVVIQTARSTGSYSRRIQRRTEVIPNPVYPPETRGLVPSPRENGLRTLLGVGRLEHQKGFDLLLRAFAEVARNRSTWRLHVYGEGSQQDALVHLAGQLAIADRVTFAGRTRDISDVYASADLFVMASRFEGFPNALTEAMAHGLPVIATDCPTGPREIVTPNVDGLLVPSEDVRALAGAMAQLMDDEPRRLAMGLRSREITSRLNPQTIMAEWDRVVARILNQ